MNDIGYCTAVFGNFDEQLEKYEHNYYSVVDVSLASFTDKKYSSGRGVYKTMLAWFGIAIFCLLL
jgi:hypothetical protein